MLFLSASHPSSRPSGLRDSKLHTILRLSNGALKGVPAGTAKLDFRMTDLDKPDFRHGGGTVAYHGQASIPCGAFSAGFVGPSPPPGQVHTYRFVIRALDAQGSALATTTASRKYP